MAAVHDLDGGGGADHDDRRAEYQRLLAAEPAVGTAAGDEGGGAAPAAAAAAAGAGSAAAAAAAAAAGGESTVVPVAAGGGGKTELGLSPRRWWVVSMLAFLFMLHNWFWTMWSPLQDVAISRYGWSSTNIKIFAAWESYVVPLLLITPWLIDRLGVRASMTLAILFTFTGAVLRNLTTDSPTALVLTEIAQAINALGSTIIVVLPPKVSAVWFNSQDRALASSIMWGGANAGIGLGMLMGLFIQTSDQLQQLLDWQLVLASTLLALALLDFCVAPDGAAPRLPPSESEAAARRSYRPMRVSDSLLSLCRLGSNTSQFFVIWTSASLVIGSFAAFTSILYPIMAPLGYSQTECASLGLVMSPISVLGSLAAPLVLRLAGTAKVTLLLAFAIATASWAAFCWLVAVDSPMAPLYVFVVLSGFVGSTAQPLVFEEAAECVFPLDPVRGSAALLLGVNGMQFVFVTLALWLPASLPLWMLPVFCGIGLLVLAFYRPHHARNRLDHHSA